MKYVKAEAEVVKFDNTDVIVTSPQGCPGPNQKPPQCNSYGQKGPR